MLFIVTFLVYFCFIQTIDGHGYLADPPARSSAWMFDEEFRKCCTHYDHNSMFCGGFQKQWNVNGGKCSVCGEDYSREKKLFGLGDTKYLGKIVRTYKQGAVIPVTVVLTANHLGSFEFRVCNLDETPEKDATQECLDLNQLDVNQQSNVFPVIATHTTVHMNVTLPADLFCEHCVFQWKYRTGNSWGSFNGNSCPGCGRENEEFYGCSDIRILPKSSSNARNLPVSNEAARQTRSIQLTRKCTSALTYSHAFDIAATMEQYCQSICSTDCTTEDIDGNSILYENCKRSCDRLCACE